MKDLSKTPLFDVLSKQWVHKMNIKTFPFISLLNTDSIFGFLARFTDFYVVDGPDNMGFPSHGMNEKVVLDVCK